MQGWQQKYHSRQGKLCQGSSCVDYISNKFLVFTKITSLLVYSQNNDISHKMTSFSRDYDGKKVYCLSVNDIEHVRFEHFPKTSEQIALEEEINILKNNSNSENHQQLESCERQLNKIQKSRQFNLTPKTFYTTFYYEDLKKDNSCKIAKKYQTLLKVKMVQLPVNLNDATTGHKLQGSSKNELIVESWNYTTPGWVYAVISRVRKLEGLFLRKKLDYKQFKKYYDKTHRELKAFDARMAAKIPLKARDIMSRE